MATESPLRMPSHSEAASFAPSTPNLAVNGQKFRGSGRDKVPNRSGSAPPSMEGSFLAVNNLICQQSSNLGNLSYSVQNSESEKQSYLALYDSSVNPNPRLPTPPIARKNRYMQSDIGRFGSNWGLTSIDYSDNNSLHFSQVSLSTHKEECEDDRSSHQPSDDLVEQVNGFWSGEDASSLVGQSRSLVDLIQEDYPRTPSPVYNQSHSFSSGTTDEAADHDVDSSSLHNSPFSTSNVLASTVGTDRISLSFNADPSTAPVSSSSPHKCTGATNPMQPLLKGDLKIQDVIIIESEMKDLSISSLPVSKDQKFQQQWPHRYQDNVQQHQVQKQQQSNSFQVHSGKSQLISQGLNSTYISMDQFLHGPSKFTAEVQPVLQSSGFTPPLYASATAYMASPNPIYSNVQPPGLYSPQYGVGGYALSSAAIPPFFPGYPPHGAIPMVYNGPDSPNFNARMPGAPTGGSYAHGTDLQHMNRFYGQLGYPMQPPFTDPAHMQYYQQPYGPAYNVSGQFDPLASGIGVLGNQNSAYETKKGSFAAVGSDKKLHHQISGVNDLYQGRGAIISHYFGSPSNMGMLMQYPSSPLASPVLPGSPVGGTGSSGGTNGLRFPPGTGRYAAVYSGWQGQRGLENSNCTKIYNFIEELKSGKGHRFELSDIAGNIVEFSADQHGSRFIQQKLETCSPEEKASVFKEVLPFAPKLMTDVFGNYVIQKFFEYGSPEQRKDLANQLTGQILPLSLQMYGCRVIQKALEVIELDQKARLVLELDGHVMRCVRDQNGNHVIQKCIESIPTEKIGFIITAFRSHVAALSMHPYGCRVIQRVLERCTDELQCQFIVDEILESVCVLAQDQYGNYVTQIMMKDQFGNYVVQKILDTCTDIQREMLLNRIKTHVHALKKYTYGKHIVARYDQQFGEENQAS
ncbi:pumilio homolog 6, chloroplastic isoform X2 [Manihot esculenta]|uniref:Uncharacterized protein n=2 Tax=Manihot esculenta TaxID=3983 RepID=A0ACB7GH00_MANES|nr:pumilio homolog 6, chloroplastic isoform X2 [Manihot esculenta]KAG8639601.1 hypothetical protein MANES_14G158384v8 [Manihot esculenta]KAG8639602.1 hypothetical protein MANES_14G158384v8 [Manihot esculenta]